MRKEEEHAFSVKAYKERIKEIKRYEKAVADCQEMQRGPLHH